MLLKQELDKDGTRSAARAKGGLAGWAVPVPSAKRLREETVPPKSLGCWLPSPCISTQLASCPPLGEEPPYAVGAHT